MLRCPRNRTNACCFSLPNGGKENDGYALKKRDQGRCKSVDLPRIRLDEIFQGDVEKRYADQKKTARFRLPLVSEIFILGEFLL